MKERFMLFVFLLHVLTPGTSLASKIDSLLRTLVKKGVITHEEMEEIGAEQGGQKAGENRGISLKGLKFGVLAYVDYSNGKEAKPGGEDSYNRFRITRGYFTVKKSLTPWLSGRMTIDAHQDNNGDYEERLKYLYAEVRPPDLGFLTDMKAEIGLGHIPWLDFEEHLNPYRCQGTMAIERAGVFNSADIGISIRGYFGGKLKDAEARTGNKHYAGRYGSWHFGVYNGSGYHESEDNNNKVLEGRLTLRPFPSFLPGFQVSYMGVYGEGNKKTSSGSYPDYTVNLFMISYEHPRFIFSSQYFRTEGNAKGSWVDTAGDAIATEGYSIFVSHNLPFEIFSKKRLHLFLRYDHFNQDEDNSITDDAYYSMIIGGIACHIYKENLVLLDFETTKYGNGAGRKGDIPTAGNDLGDDYRIQVVWQIKL